MLNVPFKYKKPRLVLASLRLLFVGVVSRRVTQREHITAQVAWLSTRPKWVACYQLADAQLILVKEVADGVRESAQQ